MKKCKAIIFDYDGTIKELSEQRISKEVEKTLKEIKELGIRIIVATGRPHNDCKYLIEEGLVDCIVSANGALTDTNNIVIHDKKIDNDKVLRFYNFTIEHKISATFYSRKMQVNGIQTSLLDLGLKEIMNLDSNKLSIINLNLEQEVFLMCAFVENRFDQKLKDVFPNMVLSRWHSKIVSILGTEVDKVTGISKALEYYNILPSECVAVGDGTNDIEMLEYVNYGIAIGRENKRLLSISDEIIDRVDRNLISLIF